MRTFKFRYWDGSQMREPYCEPGDLQVANINDALNDCPHLMQYTGLKDANGVEIYEGDILAGRYQPYGPSPNFYTMGAVEFESPYFGVRHFGYWYDEKHEQRYEYEAKDRIGALLHHWKHDLCGATVIGNIYENPELLETPEKTL